MNPAFVVMFSYLFLVGPNSEYENQLVVCDPTQCIVLQPQPRMIADSSNRSSRGSSRALTMYNHQQETTCSVAQCFPDRMKLIKKADRSGVMVRYQDYLKTSSNKQPNSSARGRK